MTKMEKRVLDNLDNIKEWAKQGFNARRIAKELNMSDKTLYRIKDKYPEVKQALETYSTKHQLAVEESLIYQLTRRTKRTIKYEYLRLNEYEISNLKEDEYEIHGNKYFIKVPKEEIIEDYAPNSGMMSLYLSQTDPDRWGKEKKEITIKDNREDPSIEATKNLIDAINNGTLNPTDEEDDSDGSN